MIVWKDDSVPPLRWKLDIIMGLYPGPDDIVRVVNVKYASGSVVW